jgi:peptide deformylase
MALLKILTYPNPILEKKSVKIANPTAPEIRELVMDMLETMEANNGLGLAAPQVGKNVKLCIVKLDGKTYILINPKIQYKSFSKEVCEEGCLSFPGQFIPVKRAKKIRVKAQDRDGNKIMIKADGLLARALQHEIDHLDGILFIEKKVKIKKK